MFVCFFKKRKNKWKKNLRQRACGAYQTQHPALLSPVPHSHVAASNLSFTIFPRHPLPPSSEIAAGNVLLTAGAVTVKYNGIKVSLQVVSSFSSSSSLKFSQRATKSTNSGGNQYKRDHYMWQAALPALWKRPKRIIIIILLLYPKKQHFTSFSCARLCVTISSKTYLCLSRQTQKLRPTPLIKVSTVTAQSPKLPDDCF